LRHHAAVAAGEGRIEQGGDSRKSGIAQADRHQLGIGEHRARIVLDADHVQHGRITWPKHRAQGQRHGQGVRRRDVAVKAFIAPADFEPVEVGKARHDVAERAQSAPACLLGERGAGNGDASVVAVVDNDNLGNRRTWRGRPKAGITPARRDD